MVCKSTLQCAVLMLGLTGPAFAQHQELDGVEVKQSGEDYAAAIRFRGIDAEVAYFDPTQPPPPLETTQSLGRTESTDGRATDLDIQVTGGDTFLFVVMLMILMGILYIVVVFGGGLPVSFARQPDENDEEYSPDIESGPRAPVTMGLQAILNMADRQLALVALCKSILARVVAAEGVLLQKSWTDRDTLRRVPRDHAHRDALQALVLDSEKAQFGGRDVTEEEFRAHVTRLQPLLSGAGA